MKKRIVKADEPDAQYQATFGTVSRIIDAPGYQLPILWALSNQERSGKNKENETNR